MPPSGALILSDEVQSLKTSGSLAARRVPPSGALRNWNATHSGSDCNVTCNVEHIWQRHVTQNPFGIQNL